MQNTRPDRWTLIIHWRNITYNRRQRFLHFLTLCSATDSGPVSSPEAVVLLLARDRLHGTCLSGIPVSSRDYSPELSPFSLLRMYVRSNAVKKNRQSSSINQELSPVFRDNLFKGYLTRLDSLNRNAPRSSPSVSINNLISHFSVYVVTMYGPCLIPHSAMIEFHPIGIPHRSETRYASKLISGPMYIRTSIVEYDKRAWWERICGRW